MLHHTFIYAAHSGGL